MGATTYYATNWTVPMPSFPGVGVSLCREFAFTLSAALVDDDVIKLCPLSCKGAPIVIEDYYIDMPDCDTGGTPAIKFDLGTSTTNERARFVAATTIGQAAGKIDLNGEGVAAACPDVVDVNCDFQLQVETAPQTGATTGTLRGWLKFHFIGAPSPV